MRSASSRRAYGYGRVFNAPRVISSSLSSTALISSTTCLRHSSPSSLSKKDSSPPMGPVRHNPKPTCTLTEARCVDSHWSIGIGRRLEVVRYTKKSTCSMFPLLWIRPPGSTRVYFSISVTSFTLARDGNCNCNGLSRRMRGDL
jgi:hypothetical protein